MSPNTASPRTRTALARSRSVSTSTLWAVGLYAMVASCSATMDTERAPSPREAAGAWTLSDAQGDRPVNIRRGALSVASVCDAEDIEAQMDRHGRLKGTNVRTATCEADRRIYSLVGTQSTLVRINARTLELRHRRERVRLTRT